MSQVKSAAAAAAAVRRETSTSDELRLVFVGKTGAGKSSTASIIAGKKDVFRAGCLGRSETKICQCERVEVLGHKLLLVDTPGIFDTSRSRAEIESEIGEFVKITAPGPHAILFVTSAANRFTQEEVGVIKKLEEMFGKAIEEYLIIVVTRTENWEEDDVDVTTFLFDLPEEAKQIIGKCIASNRAIAFQNKFQRDGSPRDTTQVKKLLDMIKETVRRNGNKCYTERHWKEAEEEMKRREQEILGQEMKEERELVEKIEREQRAKLKEEYDAKMKEMQEKQEKERQEREARERKAREKREQELILKMEQMRLETEQKMENMRAEDRARAQEELQRAEKRMEEQRRRDQEMADRMLQQAQESAQRMEAMFRTMIEQGRQDAERRHEDLMELERRRLDEEARYRARKEEEEKARRRQEENQSKCYIL